MILSKKRKTTKKSTDPKRHFVIINADLEYFCGFKYGGKFNWHNSYEQAKKFEDIRKFESIKKYYKDKEVIMDWVE